MYKTNSRTDSIDLTVELTDDPTNELKTVLSIRYIE